MVSIRYQVPFSFGFLAKPSEYSPVVRSWTQVDAMIQVSDRVYILECAGKGGWMPEHSWIGDDSKETTQDQFRDCECLVSIDN